MRKKNQKLIAHLQDIPNHMLEHHLSTIWNVDGVQVTSLIWQKTSLFDLDMTPGGKMNIPNPYCTSARHAHTYVEYQLSTPENVDVVQLTNFRDK